MKRAFFQFCILSAAFWMGGCGGGTESFSTLRRPVDIVSSATDLSISNATTRVAYVADQYSRGVVVVNQRNDRILDTDPNPEFNETILPVGGIPVAVAVEERTGSPRVFVADADPLRPSIVAFDAVPPSDPSSDVLAHAPTDIGVTPIGRASRPLVRNSGRTSNPIVEELLVHPAAARNESWVLEYMGEDSGYRVTGSLSGEQPTRAQEGVPYHSDNGALSFTVMEGGDRTNKGDKVEFATAVTRDLPLPSGIPVDIEIDSGLLFVLTANPPQLLAYDLATLADARAPLPLPGGIAVPSGMALGDGHIYVADSSADRFFDVTVDAWTVAAVAQGVRSGSIGYDPATKAVYLFPIGGITAWIWDTTTASLLPALRLSDRGLGFTSYSWQGESRALIPTAVGGTDVLNTGTRSRIDTVITDRQPQSEALGKEFFDMGEASAPSLISIVTRDGLTLAERWQVIYEGVIAGSEGLSVQINGDLLTAPGALFQSGLALESTDRVTIGPYGAREEVAVAEVLSETELKLAAAPTQQGAQTVAIRPDSRYLVVGTRSGFQKGRLREGEAYTSDGSEISLTIRGSRTKPTTRGDFFTFLTTEGIEPISPNRRGVARKVTVFSPPDGSGLSAYVIQEGTGTLSVLNLRTLQERRTIP